MKFTPISLTGNFSLKNSVKEGDCPNCNVRVKMPVIETSVVSKLCHAPVKKFRKSYMAICPNCTKKYRLVKKTAKYGFLPSPQEFTTDDLIEFRENKPLIDITF